jgi:hypothetical protein
MPETKTCAECGREFIPRELYFKKCFNCFTGKPSLKSSKELLNIEDEIKQHDDFWGIF